MLSAGNSSKRVDTLRRAMISIKLDILRILRLVRLNKEDSYISALALQLTKAQSHAFSLRPEVGGFPVLAEVLRQA